MSWRDPNLLWLIAVVAALGGVLLFLLRRQEARLASFAEVALARRLTPGLDRRRRVARIVLRVAALVLLVVALAGPKWGFHWEEVKREGIDLIVAIDTSRSMLATDVKPNRLERAKLAVMDLVEFLQGDRIGLVAFAGTAFLECPLTLDYAAFERSLRATTVGIIPRGGTALARAIETSLAGFEAREGKHEALILITDGEDHEGDLESAVQLAAEKGVRIYTVGIGTSEGELVPQKGGSGGYVKDRRGQVVKSRLNEEVLQDIALKTNGAYVRGLGAALGLDEVFRDHIAKMERREVASSLERRYEERFQIPLSVALLLLLVEGLIGDRKSTRAGARSWFRPIVWTRRKKEEAAGSPAVVSSDWRLSVVILLSVPLLVGWFDPPGDRAAEGNRLYDEGKYDEAVSKYGDGLVDSPESPLLRFNMGTALYKQGKYDEAIASLSKVATGGDDEWVARSAYNLGNSYYRVGEGLEESDPQAAIQSYEQALVAYKRAMSVAPQDTDAKFNHELVAKKLGELKKRLEEEQQEQEQQQQEQEQQDQQEQQEDREQNQEQQQQEEQQQEGQQEEQQQQGEQEQQEESLQPQEEEQQQAGDPEDPSPQEERQQASPDQEAEEQRDQQQTAGAPQAGEPSEPTEDQHAAQAVLDTAREEELDPEDVRRPMRVMGLGEAVQDW